MGTGWGLGGEGRAENEGVGMGNGIRDGILDDWMG